MLTWDAVPLYSRRVTTFTDTNSTSPSPSNGSAETLNVSDIPSSRCLFRLRLSELPIGGTGSSSSPMLQTPTVVMTREEPESFRASSERNGYKNGTQFGSLESQVFYDPKVRGLLRTPSAMDSAGMENRKYWGGGTLAQEIMQNPKYKYLLPTPTCNDATNASLPISQAKRNDSITKRIVDGQIPSDYIPMKDGNTFRLSPLFTEEMMGFPFGWTTFPFLKQDGEPNPSKHTETPSSRK